MYMAITSRYYKRHIYNLFEYIYPMKMIKCPICGKEWDDLKVEWDGKMGINTSLVLEKIIFLH